MSTGNSPKADRNRFEKVLARQSPSPTKTAPTGKLVAYGARLPIEQHRYLRRLAVDVGIDASAIIRGMLALMEDDTQLQGRVIEAAATHAW